MKKFYVFDEKTGEYLYPYSAQASPNEPEIRDSTGKITQAQGYISPIASTPKIPPVAAENEVAIFNVVVDAWALKPDFRGQFWFDQTTGTETEIMAIGTPASNLAATLPSGLALAKAITAKISTLSRDCANSIISGFVSSALGSPYTYPSSLTDQSNLIGAVTASMNPANASTWSVKFWCEDAGGKWAFKIHSAKKIQQVLNDGVVQREAYSAKLLGLVKQAQNVVAITDLDAIVW
jgi:hypothetical protein